MINFRTWLFRAAFTGGVCLLLATLSATGGALAQSEPEPDTFTFTGDPNWMPYEAFDEQGQYLGIVSDILQRVADKADLSVNFKVSKSWVDALALAGSLQADVISGDIFDQQILKTHRFTTPYLENSLVLLAKRNIEEVQDIRAVGDRRIGIIKDYGYTWEIKAAYRDIRFIEVADVQEGLLDLSGGKLDYLITSEILGRYQISQLDLHNLHIAGRLPVSIKVGLAVSKLRPDLYQRIESALQEFRPGEVEEIVLEWVDPNSRWIARKELYRAAWALAALLLVLGLWLFLNGLQRHRLERHQQRLNNAMIASSSGVWSWQAANNRYYFSPLFFARYGYNAEQVPANENEWLYLLHSDDAGHYLRHNIRQNPPQKNSATPFELRLRLQDTAGTSHWIRMRGNVTQWHQEKPLEAMGTLEDIDHIVADERKLESIRKQLESRQTLLTSLFDTLPDMIWFKDIEGRYLNCNQRYSQFLNTKRQTLLGKTDMELALDEHALQYDQEDRQAYLSNQTLRVQRWVRRASDQEERRLEITKIPVRGNDEGSKGVLCVARDTTEGYQLQEELLRFRSFAENSAQGFGISDLDGRMIYMNPRARQLLGLAPGSNDFYLKNFIDNYPPDIQQKIQREVIPHIHSEGFWEGELRVRRGPNTTFPTQETFFILRNEDGKARYFGDVMMDISEQKRAAEQLAQARDDAEKANATKSTFLANMSHEIRTPLNAIIGYSQLLGQNQSLAPSIRHRLDAIFAAGERLLALVNDILDLSKIEAGHHELNERPYNIDAEINTSLQILRGRAEQKSVEFEVINDLYSNDYVLSDPLKLNQILMNIVGNAVKFTEQGSVTTHFWREQELIKISVTDTGPGIDPYMQDQLFEPFSQGRNVQRSGGTGLGLSLSRKLAELLSGTIEVSHTSSSGTTVLIELHLPSITPPVSGGAPSLPSPDIALATPRRILVIEDDVWCNDLLVLLLKEIGADVTSVSDGRDAVPLFLAHDYDLVLTDNQMEHMSGSEFLAEVRRQKPQDTTPIVAVTASALLHEHQNLVELGFNRVIGKPYKLDDIHAILRELTGASFVEKGAAGTPGDTVAPAPTPIRPTKTTALDSSYQGQLEMLHNVLLLTQRGNLSKLRNLQPILGESGLPSELVESLRYAIDELDMDKVESLVEQAIQSLQQIH